MSRHDDKVNQEKDTIIFLQKSKNFASLFLLGVRVGRYSQNGGFNLPHSGLEPTWVG